METHGVLRRIGSAGRVGLGVLPLDQDQFDDVIEPAVRERGVDAGAVRAADAVTARHLAEEVGRPDVLERQVAARFDLQQLANPQQLAEVATLELTHVSLPDLVQHTTIVPVNVNVVSGDQAAGRVRDPEVRSEALFQQSQTAKCRSSRLLSTGRVDEASGLLRETSANLRVEAAGLPPMMAAELTREADMMQALAEEAHVDSSRAAKVGSYDASSESRNRGRTSRSGRLLVRWAFDHKNAAGSSLLLEEWEAGRLVRLLPPELDMAQRPDADDVQPKEVASAIALSLGVTHPNHDFFAVASSHGGFTVERT